jgi:hypothetical protein
MMDRADRAHQFITCMLTDPHAHVYACLVGRSINLDTGTARPSSSSNDVDFYSQTRLSTETSWVLVHLLMRGHVQTATWKHRLALLDPSHRAIAPPRRDRQPSWTRASRINHHRWSLIASNMYSTTISNHACMIELGLAYTCWGRHCCIRLDATLVS